MLWSLNLVCLALCCFHAASAPHFGDFARERRSDGRAGLALSREIFGNITKKLRQSIREGPPDSGHSVQGKVEESRQYAPYQELHHHERHWGPYFEERNVTQVTAHVGAEALLNCRVVMLKDKTVMWLRHAAEAAQLLTVGPAPYAGDNRVASKYQYPNNWRLSIDPVKRSDAGRYLCQISTHPPRTVYADLSVLPPVLTINGDSTHDVKDKFYKAGSSIKLTCVISDEYISNVPRKLPTVAPPSSPPTPPPTAPTTTELTTKASATSNRFDVVLNRSWSVEASPATPPVSGTTTITARSETTTRAQLTPRPATDNVYGLVWRRRGEDVGRFVTWRNVSATFSVSSASQSDSGLYSCHLLNHSRVLINVHVLSGENQAAVHHDTWNKGSLFWQPQLLYLLTIAMFSFLT